MVLYLISKYFAEYLNFFKYITFRASISVLISFSIAYHFGHWLINFLRDKTSQPIRQDGPESHFAKAGTPTMGGLIIILPTLITSILFNDLGNVYILLLYFVMLVFGLLGFYDDLLKVQKKNSKGVSGKIKLLVQFITATFTCFIVNKFSENPNNVFVPVLNFYINLGSLYVLFVCIVIAGSSNAVNLTDGLDGLAIVPIITTISCFGVIAYLVGNSLYAAHLQIPHIVDTGEIAVLCSAIIGAGLGFLWYNASPAQIFMGDTGSLSMGALIGTISIIVKHELALVIIGSVFVIEAISVIIQVYYFKYTKGKRFFLMAPIHHHFEKKGLSETKITIRFWILSIISAILGLMTLKIH